MTEILNLISICRCCHQDGQFKSLQAPYLCDGHVDVYANIIYDTFGIAIKYPPIEASFSICDECISQLKQASYFKKQVLACELKFENYCKNELTGVVKVETDDEDDTQSNDNGLDCTDFDDNVPVEPIDHQQIEIKLESGLQLEKNDVCKRTLRTRKATNNKRIRKATTDNKATDDKINKTIVKKGNDVKLEESKPEVPQKHFQCKKCDLKCENRGELRKHIKEKHSSKSNQTFECEMCDGKSFVVQSQFIEHMKSHNIDRPFLCRYCKKGYPSLHAMQRHTNSQHEKTQAFQCDFCGKNFYSKSVIAIHLRLHYGTNKRFVCDVCGIRFNDRTNLKIHIRAVHENIKAYTCNFCEQAFKTKKLLKVHLRHHTGERPYNCELCGKNFVSSDQLKSHKQRKHSGIIKAKVYNCLICRKEINHRSTYRRHLMMHRGNLPYKCTICSKDFTNKYTLNRHIETHKGATFECDICIKKFTTGTVLKRHKDTVHSKNPKNIRCKNCNRFVRKIDKHKCVTEKFQCHLCDKVYASKSLLNRHIRIKHLGVWKHVCGVCGKKYTKIEGLRRHTEKIHNIKVDSVWFSTDDNVENEVLAHTISKVEIEED